MTFKAQDVSRGGSCTHPAVPALLTHIYTRIGLPDTPARCLMNPSWPGVQVQASGCSARFNQQFAYAGSAGTCDIY